MPDTYAGTHWQGCWKTHRGCCEEAVKFLAEGAEVLMLDALDRDPADPNALELRHRLALLGLDEDWDAECEEFGCHEAEEAK